MTFRRDPGTSETGRQGVSATRLRHDLRLPRVSAYGLSRVRRRGRRVLAEGRGCEWRNRTLKWPEMSERRSAAKGASGRAGHENEGPPKAFGAIAGRRRR